MGNWKALASSRQGNDSNETGTKIFLTESASWLLRKKGLRNTAELLPMESLKFVKSKISEASSSNALRLEVEFWGIFAKILLPDFFTNPAKLQNVAPRQKFANFLLPGEKLREGPRVDGIISGSGLLNTG